MSHHANSYQIWRSRMSLQLHTLMSVLYTIYIKGILMNAQILIRRIMTILNLKKKAELAKILQISSNSLNMLINRNSIGTIVQKIVENNLLDKISLDAIFADCDEDFKAYLILYNLKNSVVEDENFKDYLLSFYCKQEAKKSINKNLEKLKGQTFFSNMIDYLSGNSGRILRVLYFFIDHLEKNKIDFSDMNNIKNQFVELLNSFEIEIKDNAKFMFTISKSDKKRLIDFVVHQLDNVSILEIISSLSIAKEEIKNSMSNFDKFILKITSS